MLDWKWIAPVSVHRQHICGLICLLLGKTEPWAVSSQWPHSRQKSRTVVLHVTVYNPPAHLHLRKQPSNLCGSSISACLKVPFRQNMRTLVISIQLGIGPDQNYDTCSSANTSSWRRPCAVCIEPHRIRPKQSHPHKWLFYNLGLLPQNKSESLRATNSRMETKMLIKVPGHQEEWDNLAEKGWEGGLNRRGWVEGN